MPTQSSGHGTRREGAIRISPEELQGAMPTALSGHEATLTNQEFPSKGNDSLDKDLAQDHFPEWTSPGSGSSRVPHDIGKLSWARSLGVWQME